MADLPVVETTYLMQRLAEVRRIAGIPASIAFDLARSPLTDDNLEEVAGSFGAKKGTGWGLSDLLEETLSRAPASIPVKDLQGLQQGLIDKGYVDPGTEATGVWDPSWYGAFRRMDRDAQDAIRTGHDWKSGPITAGIHFITNTIPSQVWQGIIGTAKGLVMQTPEIVERSGLVGGAAAGMAIGGAATAAFGPGAAVGVTAGAVIGGAIGFFGDLFTDAPDESPGLLADFVDALTPWTEYKNNPKAFWEDLGYVGAAVSMIGGAKLAVSGAQAGMAGIRAATSPAQSFLPAGVSSSAATPGIALPSGVSPSAASPMVSMGQAAFQMPQAPQELGVFSRILGAAMRKPLPKTAAWWGDKVSRYGLMAQAHRPGVVLVNKVYTGLVAGQLGSRFAAGFTGPRFDQWQGTTTIEKAIATTDPLHTIDTPLGDLVDLASFLIYPERFLPFPKGAAGKAFNNLARTDGRFNRLAPFVHIHLQNQARLGNNLSYADGYAEMSEILTPAREVRIRAEFGVQTEAERLVHSQPIKPASAEKFGYSVEAAKHDIKRSILTELQAGEGTSATLERVVQLSRDEPGLFTTYLGELQDRGSGLNYVLDWDAAEALSLKYEKLIDKSSLVDVNHIIMAQEDVPRDVLSSRLPKGVSPSAATPMPPHLRMKPRGGSSFERATMQNKIAAIDASAAKLRRQAHGRDPNVNLEFLARARNLEEDSALLKEQLSAMSRGGTVLREAENMRIVPERVDTLTRADYYVYQDQYLRLRERVTAAWKADPEGRTYFEAHDAFNTFVEDLHTKGVFSDEMVAKLQTPKPPKDPADYLKRQGDHAARDIQLNPDATAELLSHGYKPVLTGEDMLFTEDVTKLADAYGVAEYSKRAHLIETLGFSPRWRENIDTYQFRVQGEQAEFTSWIADGGFAIKPKKLDQLLHDAVERLNHSGSTIGPIVKPAKGKMFIFKTDLRDLSVENLMSIPELAKLPGFDDTAALKLFHSIRRGAALGGEVSMLAPVESMRVIGRAMSINGLPGFSDAIRTFHTKDPAGWGFVKKGAALGVAESVIVNVSEGEDLKTVVSDAVKGAVGGAVAGSALRGLAKMSYGYLPDVLVRANTALRFSLSMTFDAGRYMEQNSIAYAKYGLPPMFSPRKYIAKYARENGLNKLGPGIVENGDDAWKYVSNFMDEVQGTKYFRGLEDIDRRMYMKGILGFSPRDWEAAQAVMLLERGMPMNGIRDAISHIGRYGPGRTAAEKSANFVFFPFSFSKKLLTTMGDFMIQAPARALLLHEGWRMYTESTLRDDVNDFLERHLPLLKGLWQINNLSFGLSPGSFFLEGLTENRTAVGKAMQALSAIFVPSGAAGPLSRAAGSLGDLSVLAFSPVVVTGESISRVGGVSGLLDVVTRYIPFIREMNMYFWGKKEGLLGIDTYFGQQWKALPRQLGGEGLSPYSQYTDYLDELRASKDELEPMAIAMGYVNADGLLNSKVGLPLKLRYEAQRLELMKKYPTGAAMSQEFENSALTQDRALKDLADKANRSSGEDAIVHISEEQFKWRMLATMTGLPPEVIGALSALKIRQYAIRYANDARFAELYRQLFEATYGPITMTEVT